MSESVKAPKAAKMTNAAIWAWFAGQKPKAKKKLPKGVKNDERWFRCVPMLNADRLIIGVWRTGKAVPVGVYMMRKSGEYSETTADRKGWGHRKLQFIMDDPDVSGCTVGVNRYWNGDYEKNRFTFEACGDDVIAWIADMADDKVGWMTTQSIERDPFYAIRKIEEGHLVQKRLTTIKNREDAISEWLNGMSDLPAGFDSWMRRVVYGGMHYLFYDKAEKHYACSACGGLTEGGEAPGWKRGQRVVCPKCGATCQIIKHGTQDSVTKRESVMVIQSFHDRKGRACSVQRYFYTGMTWQAGREGYRVWPAIAIELPFGRKAYCDDCYYASCELGGVQWSDKNRAMDQHGACYLYPELGALDGTAYERRGLEAAAQRGLKLDYNNLMRCYTDDKRIEYIVKGGFDNLMRDIADGRNYGCDALMPVHSAKPTAAEIMGLSGQWVARFKQHNGGALHLKWAKAAFMCGLKMTDDVWDWLVRYKIEPKDTARMLDPRIGDLSLEQIMNYVEKQVRQSLKENGGNDGYNDYYCSSRQRTAVLKWRDMLEMGEGMGVDYSHESNVRPKSLIDRHDQLAAIAREKREALEAERRAEECKEMRRKAEAEFPRIKAICDEIRPIYEFSDDEHMLIVPAGVADINREGDILGHCVSAYSYSAKSKIYLERIEKRESYIFFLRRKSDPGKPWYTMEVEPGGAVRQLRTVGDKPGSEEEREEAKAFLRKWKSAIKKKLVKAETDAARAAAERRVTNIEQLKIDGNVIRGGILKGELLWRVLANDFEELNGQKFNDMDEREESAS